MYEDILCVIPARAGSKGIPGKNMMRLGGIPLVGHSIRHAIDAGIPKNNIIVSSNDAEVLAYASLSNVTIRLRPEELCTDDASTESALLDAVESFPGRETVLLLQPTSPIRLVGRVDRCIEMYRSGDYDSLLTATPMHNFFWFEKCNGTYKWYTNYNPKSRLRRQNMSREDIKYFENGNLYITDVELLKKTHCRLGDKVCICPITEFEGMQLDTPEEMNVFRDIFKNEGVINMKVPEDKWITSQLR